MTTAQAQWDWVITSMILENRSVSEILSIMEKTPDTRTSTMSVTVTNDHISLLYSPVWVPTLTPPQLRYVLTHEILHVALQHCTTRQPTDPRQLSLYNMAADLAVNSLIPETPSCKIPPGGLLPAMFDLPDMLSMEQYVILLQDTKAGPSPMDDHSGWAESELIRDVVRQVVDTLKKSSSWDSLTGSMQERILAAQVSQIPWEKQLRHALGDLPTTDREVTYTRPNNRYGWPYGGQKRKHIDRKMVGIDDSASITPVHLSKFLAELNRLADIQPVDLQVFDAGLIGTARPYSRRQATYTFTGRGGTDYQAIMDLADRRRYHTLIILTDGEASPVPRPNHVRDILWVMVGDGDPPVPWGRVIRIR